MLHQRWPTRLAKSSHRHRSTRRRFSLKSTPRFDAASRLLPELVAALAIITLLFSLANLGGSAKASHDPRLVISEVHPSVVASESSTDSNEWVEIQNLERYPVSLEGWTIEDAQAIAQLPDFEIEPGGAVLVVGSSADIAVPAGRSLVILESANIGTGLRNDGDRVALVNPLGVRYDAVSWGSVRTPRAIDPPNPRQSIIRTPTGGQTLSDSLTPWTVGEAISAEPERHRHPLPDTTMRITMAQVDPPVGHAESITIKNISDKPLLTVNWSLTVGNSLVKLRSVRLLPDESFEVIEPDGKIGAGLSRRGGHLVLRDQHGNWLATASWGDDDTFHRQSAPPPGEPVRFSPPARVHPRVPWFQTIDLGDRLIIGSIPRRSAARQTDVSQDIERPQLPSFADQESEEAGVWISEVHPTAGQGRNDPAFEWFEITNSTHQPVSLSGWTIADNTTSDPLGDLIIPPRSSVVVGVSTEADPAISAIIEDGRIGNGLANTGDQLRLINAQGEVVSAVSWGNDRTHSSVRAPKADESVHVSSPGRAAVIAPPSAGRLSTDAETQTFPQSAQESTPLSTLSTSSTDEPTVAPAPAQPNADVAYGGEPLRITEIMPAPLTGQPEWLELFNPGDQPIDLTGWSLGDTERTSPLSGTIPANAHLVISTAELDLSGPVLVVDRIGNGLNNEADTIAVIDPQGNVVHQIRYGDDQLPAPDRGLSIALDPERWVVTAAPTPGSDKVTPLLGDAFRTASPKPEFTGQERLPIVAASQNGGTNAWMIVSFALIGVIATLLVRRWRPEIEPTDPNTDSVTYSGANDAPLIEQDFERDDENPDQ